MLRCRKKTFGILTAKVGVQKTNKPVPAEPREK